VLELPLLVLDVFQVDLKLPSQTFETSDMEVVKFGVCIVGIILPTSEFKFIVVVAGRIRCWTPAATSVKFIVVVAGRLRCWTPTATSVKFIVVVAGRLSSLLSTAATSVKFIVVAIE
jgi:hypothetical protein